MDRTLMELVFVLDRSGSMHGLEADTVGGYNSMICGQRRGGRALVTTVLFNGDSRIVHDRVPIHGVCEMSRDSYTVFGCTAMLDAVGSTIERISCEQRLSDTVPSSTIFVVITDGEENASIRYSWERVSELVTNKRSEGWRFLFYGANVDAGEVARRMGMDPGESMGYRCDSTGIREVYRSVSEKVTSLRCVDDRCPHTAI